MCLQQKMFHAKQAAHSAVMNEVVNAKQALLQLHQLLPVLLKHFTFHASLSLVLPSSNATKPSSAQRNEQLI